MVGLYSCSSGNDEGDTTLLKEVNKSLLQSNLSTDFSTIITLESLYDKTKRPETSDRASKWFTKAKKIKKLTDSIIHDIQRIKFDLIGEAGFDPLKEEKSKSAKQAVDHIFKEHKEGQLLHEKLILYKKDLQAIDSNPSIRQQITSFASFITADVVSGENAFADRYFNTTVLGAITMLNKIDNDIRVVQNKLITFCNEQISIHAMYFDAFPAYSPLITQSAAIVRPGQPITITAGIGEYSVVTKPSVKIADTNIPMNDFSFFEYELKTPSKAGDYTTSVIMKYFDPRVGKEVEVKKTINYTVLSN